MREATSRLTNNGRSWLVSKLLAHQFLSRLLYAVKMLEVRLRGSSPEMATILHQRADGSLIKVKDVQGEGKSVQHSTLHADQRSADR